MIYEFRIGTGEIFATYDNVEQISRQHDRQRLIRSVLEGKKLHLYGFGYVTDEKLIGEKVEEHRIKKYNALKRMTEYGNQR